MYFLFGNVFKLVPFCPSAPFLLDAALLCHPRTLFSPVMFGLEPDIHRHRARPHDMHIGSNALQQRFLKQPVLRSSWQQLARFNKGSRRSRCCGQAGYSLSLPDLIRQSIYRRHTKRVTPRFLDSPVKPGNERRERKLQQ